MRKKGLFLAIISVTIALLVSISSVLNIVSLKNNYLETAASNNAMVLKGIVNKLEYSLKYGKSLENFYGIDDLLSQAKAVCDGDAYIVDPAGKSLYDSFSDAGVLSGTVDEQMQGLLDGDDAYCTWTDAGTQHILISVQDKSGAIIAGFGVAYQNDRLNREIHPLVERLVRSTVIPILLGILLFIILFFAVKHKFKFQWLLAIIIPVIVFSSAVCGVSSYSVYKDGYTDLTRQTADLFSTKIKNDIDSVIRQGVRYDELNGLDNYFNGLTAGTEQIESISLVEKSAEDGALYYPMEDGEHSIRMQTSPNFVQKKLNDIIVEIIVSIVTSILISAEVIIFIIAIFTNIRTLSKGKRKTALKTEDEDTLPVGVVRGLFFFFAMFQYISMAFVPIVMAQIYRPLFGLPYEIVMCIPITVQIFMSIFSAWMCGKIISKRGWRPVAMFGISIMILGALIASMSTEPLLFIFAQIVLGFGLGCAKTAFDIFGVIVPSQANIETYTSSSNAGLIVGMSCAAAIGGVIASVVGFSGAFLVMAFFGLFVITLILIFSQNIATPPPAPLEHETPAANGKFNMQFVGYIVLMIIPYFFVSMYLDYFFPVYADANGMSTANIGHIFLLYGIATSYVGAYLCRILTKRFQNIALMASLLLLLGAFMGIFSVVNTVIAAVAFVLLIAVIDGIMPSLQYRFVFSLDTAKRLGISRALGIEGAFSSAIRGIAPLIFGFAMMYGNSGIFFSGIAIVAAAITFFVVNAKKEVNTNA